MLKSNKLIKVSIITFFVISIFFVAKSLMQNISNKKDEITVSLAQFQAFGLFFIAEQNGYFEDENLKVNVRKFNLGKDALDDTIVGNSDLATVFEIPFIRKVNQGEDLKIISSMHRSKTGSAIIGWKIKKINSVKDLKGKKVGVIKGTNSEFLLYAILEENDLSREDVNIVYTDINNIEEIFKSGEVDAVSAFNPNLFSIKNSYPEKDITVIYSSIYLENSVLTGKSETISNKKDAIVKFLRAISRAEKFSKTEKEASLNDISKSLPNLPKATIDTLWDDYELTMSLDNVLLEILKSQAIHLNDIEEPKIKDIIWKETIFTDYLKLVNPADVKLF